MPPPVSDLPFLAPSPVYCTGEESLRLTTFSNQSGLTLTCAGRVLLLTGEVKPFTFLHAPNSNRTAASTLELLPEGWLLGVTVKVTSGAAPGASVWGLLEIVRGGGTSLVAYHIIATDFISGNSPLMWPGGSVVDPLDGPGCLRVIAGATPAAGADISETVPTAARWELLAFHARLVTAVAAANRVVQLTLDDGANIFARSGQNFAQTASLTDLYDWFPGAQLMPATGLNIVLAPIPIGVRLAAAARIRTVTANIQAADQWDQVQYLVREWFDV